MSAVTRMALWVLERHEWRLFSIGRGAYMKRTDIATKAASLVAHDRVLAGEVKTRGMPSFYGDDFGGYPD